MENSHINENIKKIVGKNFKSMRIQADLTKDAMAIALEKSISYILMIERGAANLSSSLTKKICDFFEITIPQLYTDKPIKLKSVIKNQNITAFRKANQENAKFFISRKPEYSVPTFIKDILIPKNILNEYINVGDIISISKRDFNRILSSEELSRELRRLSTTTGPLEKDKKFDNNSVYVYRVKKISL